MTQVKLSSKFQIVIPEDVRERLGLEPGQLMQVWALDGHVVAGTSLGELYDEALRDPRELLVPAVCLAEVFRTMAREAGEPAALDALGVMSQATVVALHADAAIEAARAGLAHRLPLAD